MKRVKMNTEIFIERSKNKHGEKYDYSKTIYTGKRNKVIIICPKHGEFEQQAASHYYIGNGCPKCSHYSEPYTKDTILQKCRKIHKCKYEYGEFEFKNLKQTISIICPYHGEFKQSLGAHSRGRSCPKCAKVRSPISIEKFIEMAEKIHGIKYDYSRVYFDNMNCDVVIGCPEHGDFTQRASHHVYSKSGCPMCNGGKKWNNNFFIETCKKVHKDKYDYSKTIYTSMSEKVTIICPEHGEFEQIAQTHRTGGGCRRCNSRGKREHWTREVLEEIFQTPFPSVRPSWMKNPDTSKPLEVDCYSDILGLGLEYQGIQHYEPIDFFGGIEALEINVEKDRIKTNTFLKRGEILWRIDNRPLKRLGELEFKNNIREQIKDLALSEHFTPSWNPLAKKIKSFFNIQDNSH